MEQKTKIHAEDGKQEILITRDFDLPLELLFTAYTEPDIVEQWMGTKVLKLENRQHGSWQFETRDASGNVVFRSNGVVHEYVPNKKITRTFEMENTPFPVQLEFLEFEETGSETSRLTMQMIFKSVQFRDQMLSLHFAKGISMAHTRLEKIFNKSNA